jgi:hypothetical protein
MKPLLSIIGLIGVVMVMSGCTQCLDCGSMKKLHEVSQIFLDEKIVPGYQYYINGEDDHPKAIIGIDETYRLEGKFWTPVDITQEKLSYWMKRYREIPTSTNISDGSYKGIEILDPNGIRVGIWFSLFDWAAIKFPGDNVIQISTPSRLPGTGKF